LGQNLVAEQRTLGQQLMDAANELEAGSIQLGRIIKDLEDATRNQSTVLSAMQNHHGLQQKMTNQMSQATSEIGLILKEVRQAGPDLQGMAVAIDQFSRALKEIPDAMKADMLDPLKLYSSAAVNVVAGSNTLAKV